VRENLRLDSREKKIAWAGLAVLVVASIVTLLILEQGQTPKDDELGYAARLISGGTGYFTPPPGKYIIPLPLFVFRGLLAVGGLRSYLPYELVGIFFVALNGFLFFVLSVRRIGVLALAPTAILLFFGAASEVVVAGTLRLTELMAVAAGLGMLICLESFERRRLLADVAAGALLLVALFCHPLGLAFAAVVLVLIVLRRGAERWRALPVAVIPVAVWVVAWLSLRPDDQLASAPWSTVPSFVVRSAAVVGSAITGATRLAGTYTIQWVVGTAVVLAAIALLAWRWRRGWRPSPLLWAIAVALPVLWVLEAHAPGGDRGPQSPRYVYPGGVLLLLALSELAAGIRLRAEGLVALVTASLVALVLSVDDLRLNANQWGTWSDYVRAEEAGVELARDHESPAFEPEDPTARPPVPYHGLRIPAAYYLAIANEWGSSAYSAAQLARRPAPVRDTADLVIGRALGLELAPAPNAPPRGCDAQARSAPRSVVVPAGGVWLRATAGGATARLRRFGPTASYSLGSLPAGKALGLVIPPDSAPAPWQVVLAGASRVAVCPD
jgi:hypothetical protein